MFLFRNGGMRMSFARHKRDLARPVDIIGVGASQLGMVCDTPGMLNMTTRELWSWAASEALNDAGIPATEIEALFVGNMIAEHTEGQYHLPYVLAQWTGLGLSLIHISEPTRLGMISYAVFCLKKKKKKYNT